MTLKKSCHDCKHIEVCSIYHGCKKECKDLEISFQTASIADICKYFMGDANG